MDRQEKLDLYTRAKKAYYDGEGIMSDLEFDALEKELGLENRAPVGTSRNPSYTVKHPCIMGSLSKVQVKEHDGSVDWAGFLGEVKSYLDRAGEDVPLIVTPKYDGCSFEAYVKDGHLVSVSTRGDGTYGRDITEQVRPLIGTLHVFDECIYRGEVLVDRDIFLGKYADDFANPRSFVSGMLNREPEPGSAEWDERAHDLKAVVYDVRIYEDGIWKDHDWLCLKQSHITPQFFINWIKLDSWQTFKDIYCRFNEYRKRCPYALDGIVFKPVEKYRSPQEAARPKDCVAVKFMPQTAETEVTSVTWKAGKTGELAPVVCVEPVRMDGKNITKCSGYNWGYIRDNHISKGCRITLSLAGDIIPFIYKVNGHVGEPVPAVMPEGAYEEGCHLYRTMTEREKARNMFVASAKAAGIPGIGPQLAGGIFDGLSYEDPVTCSFFNQEMHDFPRNILAVSPDDVYTVLSLGIPGTKAAAALKKVRNTASLEDIIYSCCFQGCGHHASAVAAALLTGRECDTSGIQRSAYAWASSKDSCEYVRLMDVLDHIGRPLESFMPKPDVPEEADLRIPVILTGEPNGYATKAEFLKAHPEYRLTTRWTECKMVFTGSMESQTSKMKTAAKKNIPISLY